MGVLSKDNSILFLKHFLIGGALTTLLFYSFQSPESFIEIARNFIFNATLWVIMAFGLSFLNDLIGKYYSWLEKPKTRFILILSATVIYAIAAGYAFFVAWFMLLVDMEFIKASNLFFSYKMHYSILFITSLVSMFMHGSEFLANWKNSIIETERLKRENITSQYENLKNQVNPHFLFNSLNVLSTLVYKDQDLASEFINKLSGFYRYVLEVKNKEVLPINEEMQELENYIYLLKMRFGESLNFIKTNIDDDVYIVPLTLQMLVENAIKHNVVSKAKPLQINLYQEENLLVFKNNLQKKTSQDSFGIGIPNIKSRYSYLSDREVQVTETEDEFVVKLPVLKIES